MAKMMNPTLFVPMLVHLRIVKSSPALAEEYSKAPSSTGVINVAPSATIESIKEEIMSMLELDKYAANKLREKLREEGLRSGVGAVEWQFALSWEVHGLPDTIMASDPDVKGALELLEIRSGRVILLPCVTFFDGHDGSS